MRALSQTSGFMFAKLARGVHCSSAEVVVRRPARSVWRGRAFSASVLLLLCLTLAFAPAALAEGFYGGSVWPADVRSMWEPKDAARALDGLVYTADSRAGRIAIYDANGAYVGQFDGSDAPAGEELLTPAGVAIGPDANLYIADLDADRVSVFTPAGEFVRSWGGRGVANGQFFGPSDVRFDGAGLLYVADQFNDRIQVFDTQGAHIRSFGTSGSANGQLSRPDGLSITGSEIYVADALNKRVQVFSLTGGYLRQWGWTPGTSTNPTWSRYGAPSGVLSGDSRVFVADAGRPIEPALDRASVVESCTVGGALTGTYGGLGSAVNQLNQPAGMMLDPAGVLVVADQGNDRLSRFNTLNATWLTPWFYNGSTATEGMTDPQGIAADPDGSVWVADSANGRIQHFSATGAHIATLVTGLSEPSGIAVAADGARICVVEAGAHRVSVFDRTGALVVRFGSAGSAAGQFSAPRGVAIAANGDIVVADTGNNRLQRFTAAGGHLQTIGSAGGLLGQLRQPQDVSIAADGKICVADTDNHRVQVFDAGGAVIRAFGSIGSTAGLLREPGGISWDPSTGRIVVADTGNYRFQIFDEDGAPVTLVGGRGASLGEFRRLSGVAVTAAGGIYTTDTGNDCVQRFLYDAVPPTTTATGIVAGWVNHPTTVTLTGSDAASGVEATYYRIGNGSTVLYEGPFVVDAQGVTAMRYWSVDAAGNIEPETLASIQIDSEPPAGTMGLVGPSVVATTQVQISSNVTGANRMRVNGGAGWSGIMGYSALATVTVSGEGARTISAQYLDAVDNTLTLSTDVLVDLTGPTTTVTGAPASGFAPGNVTLTVSATDALTSVAATYVSVDGAPEQLLVGSSVVVSGHGAHTVSARSVDAVGNGGPVAQTSFEIDTVFPSGTMTVQNGAAVVGSSALKITNTVAGATLMRYDLGEGFAAWQPYASMFEGATPGDGHFVVRGQFKDVAGNTLELASELDVDFEPPFVTLDGVPAGGSADVPPVTLTLEATDTPAGVAAIYYSLDGAPDQAYEAPIFIAEPGDHRIVYRAVDGAGNESTPVSADFHIGWPVPTGEASLAGGAAAVAATSVGLHIEATGASEMRVDVDGALGAFVPFAEDSSVVFGGQGTRKVDVTLRTPDGKTFVTFDTVVVDTSGPAISLHGAPSAPTSSTVMLSLDVTDALTSVAAVYYTLDAAAEMPYTGAVVVGTDGPHVFSYRALDALGNETTGESVFAVDRTPPSGSMTLAHGASVIATTTVHIDSGFVNGAGDMCFDGGTGFGERVPYSAFGSVKVSGEGTRTVTARYFDAVDNVLELTGSVFVDVSAPVVTVTGAPSQPATGTVTLLVSATDAYSGVAGTWVSVDGAPEYLLVEPAVVVSGAGAHTVSVRAVDAAGNEADPVVSEFVVDPFTPGGTVSLGGGAAAVATSTVSLLADAHNTTDMRVDVDDVIGSFVPYAPHGTVTFSGDGVRHVDVVLRSEIGRTVIASDSIIVDTTGPSVSLSGIPSETAPETVTVTMNATDALSDVEALYYVLDDDGEVPYSGPVSVGTEGEHAISYRAVDALGNETTGQAAFTISLSAPVGTMDLANGAGTVGTTQVTIVSNVVDATTMRFDTGSGFGPWVPFSRDATVTLPGEGAFLVTAEYRSAGGLTMTASDSVAVDLTGPVSDRAGGHVTRLRRLDALRWAYGTTVEWRVRDLGVVESGVGGYRYRLQNGVPTSTPTPRANLGMLRTSTAVEVGGVDLIGNVGAWRPYALRFGTFASPRVPKTAAANAAFTSRIPGVSVRAGEAYSLRWYCRQTDGTYSFARRFPMTQARVGSTPGLTATARLPRGVWVGAVERATLGGMDLGVPSSPVVVR